MTRIPETLEYISKNGNGWMNKIKCNCYETLRDYYRRTQIFVDVVLPSFIVKERYINGD